MFSEFKTAYDSLKFAKEALTFAVNEKVEDKVKERVGEAMDKIGKVQDNLFALREELSRLQEENHALKETIREHHGWEMKSARYILVSTPANDLIYKFDGSPEHYACPVCFVKNEIQILQWYDKPYRYECKCCDKQFRMKDYPDAGIISGGSDYHPF